MAPGRAGARPRHVPLRTCVGCRQVRPKRELVRVVRTPQGEVELDPTGKRAGRGAYLCPSVECLEKARRTHQLERTLQHPVDPAVWEALALRLRQQAPSASQAGPAGSV